MARDLYCFVFVPFSLVQPASDAEKNGTEVSMAHLNL